MNYREVPHFIVKENLQKTEQTGIKFTDILTKEILRDICCNITGQAEYTCNYVGNEYSDEYVERGYNKGRMIIMLYEDYVAYISFSETEIRGRNSSIQSVPTAFNKFYKSSFDKKKIFYYFLSFSGNAKTEYLKFIYRLMKTIGFEFLNDEVLFEEKVKPFNSIDDIIFSRSVNASRNSGNNSTYITKSSKDEIDIYGKTYGANKYETTLICYALSLLYTSERKIILYEIVDNGLTQLPSVCLEIINEMGRIEDRPVDMTLEKTRFESGGNLRSPRFVYNLFEKLGSKKCAMCSCEIPELIQGAHIWPVSEIKKNNLLSEDRKLNYALDGENGIWLCENHHKMLDENLVRIYDNGDIRYEENLEIKYISFIREITTITKLSDDILTPSFIDYLGKRYMSA